MSSEEIMEAYYDLPNKQKVEVLDAAIGHMQQYNGRSVDACIVLGMIDKFPKKYKLDEESD
jgi:hypothetical protein